MMVLKAAKELTPILAAPIYNQVLTVNQKGFSIIEIMVAIALVAIILIGIPLTNSNSDRDLMNESIDNLRRAIRFASDEAVLKNSLVRINFNLDAVPQEFIVEYASSSKLTLTKPNNSNTNFSLLERERAEKKAQEFNRKFTISADFSESPIKVKEGIQIEGIVTSYLNEVVREGEMGVYFYPTGERDNAVIFLSSFSEVGMLAIEPFETNTRTEFLVLEDVNQDNFDTKRDRGISELYQEWLKE